MMWWLPPVTPHRMIKSTSPAEAADMGSHGDLPQEEDPEKYEKHFAAYVGEGIEGDDLEDLYKGVRSYDSGLLALLKTKYFLPKGKSKS